MPGLTRWYDPYIAHFAQADSIVPGGVQGLDRYAYVSNSAINFTDPSGHSEDCGLADQYCQRGVLVLPITEPSKDCTDDCYDAYLTYKEVANALGRVPTMDEIIYMTAYAEYAAYSDTPGVTAFGREGLARNYYLQCGKDGCQGDELYLFLGAYEPWGDRAGVNNNKKTPVQRSGRLVSLLGTNADWLWADVNEKIMNKGFADSQGWMSDKIAPDRPWQWFGPMEIRPHSGIQVCYQKNCDVALLVDLGGGQYFVMVTGYQDSVFKEDDWK